MMISHKSFAEKLQGEWKCLFFKNTITDEVYKEDMVLVISQNIISCLPASNQWWPAVSSFEPVGSQDAGYFMREDGSFFQLKPADDDRLILELMQKNEDGAMSSLLFNFEPTEAE